jgi:hypothetical protein
MGNKNATQQYEELSARKGNYDQLDDICVFGVRI